MDELDRIVKALEGLPRRTFAKESKALAAAGDYAANEVMSATATAGAGTAWVFNCARAPGRSFEIVGIRARITEPAVVNRLELNFFRRNPTGSELDDNAAYNMVVADNMGSSLGARSLPAFTDLGDAAIVDDPDVRMEITPEPDDGAVYVIVKTLDAISTESAGMLLEIELELIQH